MPKKLLVGGANIDDAHIRQPAFIGAQNLLDRDYYITVLREKPDNCDVKKYNIKSAVLEVIKTKNKYIVTDILKYGTTKLKNTIFSDRLKLLKKLSIEDPNLIISAYTYFDSTKKYGAQFKKIIRDEKTANMMIFKGASKYGQTYKWINPTILKIRGFIKNGKILFKNYYGALAPLKNDEFNINSLISKLSAPYGHVIIYMAANKIKIKKAVATDTIISTLPFAAAIWRQLNKGLTFTSFYGEDLVMMKKINRFFEYNKLFTNIEKNKTLFDLGAGRGANIMMWRQKNLNVYAAEPNIKNYQTLLKKRKIYDFRALNAAGQETNKLMNFLPKSGADYFIMIHSLTFFFEDEQTLDNLVSLISSVLKSGGKFMGVVMDGKKLLQETKNNNKIECPPFYIARDRNKITINIDDPVSLVRNQTEYIVDYDKLVKKLAAKNIIQLETGFAKQSNILNKCPKWFSSLNRYFIFKKM